MIDGIDYGPLAQLVGKWSGNKGRDLAPDEQIGADETAFSDELTFIPCGAARNAEEQTLVALRYHHLVRRSGNGRVFHDQIGHWLYEPSTGKVMHSLSIPRGVCLLAGGGYQDVNGETVFQVSARAGDETFGIVQSPFMLEKAKTMAFEMTMKVKGDELSYREMTSLHIYGKDFDHLDQSVLSRIVNI